MVKIGLDNGYGQVKAVNAGTRQQVVFPSVVDKATNELMDKDHAYYTYADATGRYLVGEDAIVHGNASVPSIDSSYIETPYYRVQALYAIESCIPDTKKKGQPVQVELVTGLPVEFYKKDRKTLEQVARGWENARVKVSSVQVVPQPLGTLMDLSIDWEGNSTMDFQKRRVALIDVGQGTIDAIEIAGGRVAPSFHGRSVGISRMYDDLYAVLSKAYPGSGIQRVDIPQIAKDGHFIHFGEEKPILKHVKDARRRMAETVASVMAEAWPSTAPLYRVIVTGGGAEVLREELPKVINPKQLIIPDDPAMSNARGFAKISMTAKRA